MGAEQAANAYRAELTQLSSQVAAAQDMASMWQGRAEGFQQQLDQALLGQGRAEGLLQQLDQATLRAEGLQQQLDGAVLQREASEEEHRAAAAATAEHSDRIRQVQ